MSKEIHSPDVLHIWHNCSPTQPPFNPTRVKYWKLFYFIFLISVKNGESLKYSSLFCNPTTTNIIIWCKGRIWIIYIIIQSLVVLIVYQWTQHTGWQNISNWPYLPWYKGQDYWEGSIELFSNSLIIGKVTIISGAGTSCVTQES